MKNNLNLFKATIVLLTLFSMTFCSSPKRDTKLDDNIKKYSYIWDEIMNNGNLDILNDSNFTTDVVMNDGPKDIVGIDSAKVFYAKFLTGFTNIQYIIIDIFGQDEKLVVHWTLKGIHTGDYNGIAATGNTINIEGTTLVRIVNGKIAEEKDFMDNLEFFQQLGVIPRE